MKKIIYPEIPLDGVKAVLMDLDNTLYVCREQNIRALKAVYSFIHHELKVSFDAFFDEVNACFEARFDEVGRTPSAHCRFFVFEQVLINHNIPKTWVKAFEMEKIFWRHLFKRIRADKNAKEFLKKCHEKEIKVCLLTNLFAEIQIKKLKKLKLEDYIDMIVANDNVGVDKPHPDIYDYALKRLGLTKSDVIMVGDNPNTDIKGAEAVGIKAYQVFPPKKNNACEVFNF